METYQEASLRLIKEAQAMGLTTSSPALKTPWIMIGENKVWFKKNATYLNSLTTGSDRRGMSLEIVFTW